MRKIHTSSDKNGTCISFYDYEEEDNFDAFLAFVCGKLGVKVPPVIVCYTLIAEFEYADTVLTASCNYGCYLRIPPESQLSAETIIEKCYGQLNPDQIATFSDA